MFLDVVVSLDATDDFLKARVMNLPESVVAGTHNTEEGWLSHHLSCNRLVPTFACFSFFAILVSHSGGGDLIIRDCIRVI